ncbi:hypothetical protein TNCV_2696421 [Trichonephila clavipes]|nr:hypothetical protein TNCV_2696421 [Trichonephila clavipes]
MHITVPEISENRDQLIVEHLCIFCEVGEGSPTLVNRTSSGTVFLLLGKFTGKQNSFIRKTKYLCVVCVCAKVRDDLQSLEDKITRRFQDFKKIDPKFNSLAITDNIDISPEELQLELIDLKSDHSVKLIMGHEDELTIELQEILKEEHQETQRNVSPSEQEEDKRGPMPTSVIKDLLKIGRLSEQWS